VNGNCFLNTVSDRVEAALQALQQKAEARERRAAARRAMQPAVALARARPQDLARYEQRQLARVLYLVCRRGHGRLAALERGALAEHGEEGGKVFFRESYGY
jgi:hypothetical protein